MKLLASITLACVLIASAVGALAQGVSVLNPLDPSYPLLSFVYAPPKGEGWRELASAPDSIRLVYAEQQGETVNTRADFTAQSFEISTAQKVQLPDAATLTRLSMSQRLQEKKDEGTELVAMSPPKPLAGGLPIFEYALVVKVGGEDVFENYFVALAPNKSEYMAAKVVTKDKDFREQTYFKALQDSVAQLTFPGAASTAGDAQAPAAPETNSDAARN